MPDVAQLGIAVDSSQVAKAKAELASLAPAAASAQTAANNVAKAAGNVATAMPAAAQATATVTAALQAQTAAAAPAAAALQRNANAVRTAGAGVQQAGQNAAGVVKLNAFQVQNLSYQVNDLAQVLATGQSPFRAIIQQGSQIVQLFGPGVGVGAALKAIGPAFVSFFLNPLTLATVGLAVATQAAFSFFGYITSQGATVEDQLKAHKTLIDDISRNYGEGTEGVRAFGLAEGEMLRSSALLAQIENAKTLSQELAKLSHTLDPIYMPLSTQTIDRVFANMHVPAGLIADAQRFREEIEHGTADAIKYRKHLDEIGRTFPTSENLRFIESEKQATQKAYDLAISAEKLGASQRLAAGMATEHDRALLGLSTTIGKLILLNDQLRNSFATGFGVGDLQQGLAGAPSKMPQWQFDNRFDPTGTALKSNLALTESAKDRVRAIKDLIGASEIEIRTMGQSIGQIELARSNWASYTTLRAEAEHNHTAFDDAQYARLQRENAALAKLKQTEAEVAAARNLSFAGSQIGRTGVDQTVASKLRELYGDDYMAHMNDAIAGQIRFNDVLSETKDTAGGALKSFLSDLRQGKSLGDAAANAIGKIEDKLFDLATNQVISGLFGGGQSGGGFFGKILSFFTGGIGGGGVGSASTGYIRGGINHGGYGPGDTMPSRFIHASYFDDAPRYHTGIGPGERPAVIRDDESVLTPGQMRQLAPAGGASARMGLDIVINNAPAGTTASKSQGQNGRMQVAINLPRMVDDSAASAIDSGESAMNKALERRYNLSPRL